MKKLQWMIFFALLLLLSSCLPFNTPASQEDAPNVETIVAATIAEISAQTQAALPKSTATPVFTATPSNTPVPPTITPTNTATFVIYTWTPSPTNTATLTNTPTITTTPAAFECRLVSQTPANGTVMGSRNDFDWFWTVTNIGTKDWLESDIDYLYVSGEEMHKKEAYDLPSDVLSGDDIKLGVDMIAPKQPGTYSTTWIMKRGSQTFCSVTLKIIVQ